MFDYHAGDNFKDVEAISTGSPSTVFTLIEDNAFRSLDYYRADNNNNPDVDEYFMGRAHEHTTDGPTVTP